MKELLAHFDRKFLGNSLGQWLIAVAVFLAIFFAVQFVRRLIRSREQRWRHAGNPALELLGGLAASTSRLVVLSVALYFSEGLLQLAPAVDRIVEIIIVAGIAVQLALWAVAALRFAIERYYHRRLGTDATGTPAAIGVLMFVGQVVIWALFALLALSNLGVNITALVAGLGIGGIAIALAVQTLLGDLLASLSIAIDKPFEVGDALRIDDIEGTVEHIGVRSTHVRSVTGEQVILPNADLLKGRIRNLGRMPEKRVLTRLRLAYDTPATLVGQAPELVREAVTTVEGTRFVSCLLAEIGQYAFEYELIYFIANRDGLIPVATDAVNRGILARFGAAGIGFAYPTNRQFSA